VLTDPPLFASFSSEAGLPRKLTLAPKEAAPFALRAAKASAWAGEQQRSLAVGRLRLGGGLFSLVKAAPHLEGVC